MKQISFKLEIFEGPLDLLLHLINKNKLSLYDIPVSEITEQYMDYLSEMKHFDIEVSSEFLVIAAHLLYVKSKMLLPKYNGEPEEEDDPRTELTQRLIEYKRFKEAAQYLREREFSGRSTHYRAREYIEPLLIDESLAHVTLTHLTTAIDDISERITYRRPLTSKNFARFAGRELVSVFSRVKALLGKLKLFKKMRLMDLFRGTATRDETVASFLAVLELMKMNRVSVSGNGSDTEIKYIKRKKGAPEIIGDSKA